MHGWLVVGDSADDLLTDADKPIQSLCQNSSIDEKIN